MKTAGVGKRTKYEGYKSFDYLEPGTDYREFKLAKELDRVPSRKVEVSDAQEERVWRLLDQNVVVSLHDHCVMIPEDPSELAEHRRQVQQAQRGDGEHRGGQQQQRQFEGGRHRRERSAASPVPAVEVPEYHRPKACLTPL